MIPRRYLLAMLGLVAVNLSIGAAFYPRLPEIVPTHWNISGQADGQGPRWILTFLIPLASAGLIGLLAVLPLVGPFKANFERFRVTYGRICLTIILAMSALDVVFLLAGAGYPLRIGATLCVVMGLMLAVMGNWLGKVRRNFYVGVRTRWTLANEVVWEKTHRISAKLFVVHGLVSAVVGLVGPPDWICFAVLVGGILVTTVWAIVYSFVCYRRVGEMDDLHATDTNGGTH